MYCFNGILTISRCVVFVSAICWKFLLHAIAAFQGQVIRLDVCVFGCVFIHYVYLFKNDVV